MLNDTDFFFIYLFIHLYATILLSCSIKFKLLWTQNMRELCGKWEMNLWEEIEALKELS